MHGLNVNHKQAPLIREPLQLVRPAIDEAELASREHVPNRGADEHLVRLGACHHASPEMYSDAGHPARVELDLASVNASANMEAECCHPFDRLARGAHRQRGCVEHGEEPVTGRVDLDAVVPVKDAPDLVVMPPEQRDPSRVADLLQAIRRSHHVGKQDRLHQARHVTTPCYSPSTILARTTTGQGQG